MLFDAFGQIALDDLASIVFLFCVMDGVIVRHGAKICSSILVFVYYGTRLFRHLSRRREHDHTIVTLFGEYQTSIYDQMINAEYMLCIFILKQIVTLIWKKKKCVNIVQRPYIKWE